MLFLRILVGRRKKRKKEVKIKKCKMMSFIMEGTRVEMKLRKKVRNRSFRIW